MSGCVFYVVNQTMFQLGWPAAPPEAASGPPPLLVALAAGLDQLQGVLVAINSASMHALEPRRLIFRVVTTADQKEELVQRMREKLPAELDVDAVVFDPWFPRITPLLGGNSSKRAELFNPFNFAAFYLHELFPHSPRVLYLDTDVVVLGDLPRELAEVDLDGKPAGAVEDCSQRLARYVNMTRIKQARLAANLSSLKLRARPESCVTNRGVVLVDTAQWRASGITDAIEVLLQLHLAPGTGPLWRAGVSQPPFLLAIAGQFKDLGLEFNVRGLGRHRIPAVDIELAKRQKVWRPYYDEFLIPVSVTSPGGALMPFFSPWAHRANILHYNGVLKPNAAKRRSSDPMLPPSSKKMGKKRRLAWGSAPLCSCGDACVQECAAIWWDHLPTGDPGKMTPPEGGG